MSKPNPDVVDSFVQELIEQIHILKIENIESWSQGNLKEDKKSTDFVDAETKSLYKRWNQIKKGTPDNGK